MLGFATQVFEHLYLRRITSRTHCVKKQGLFSAQFRIEIASELCIRCPLRFYALGTQIHISCKFEFIESYINIILYIYHSSYTFLNIYIYIYIYSLGPAGNSFLTDSICFVFHCFQTFCVLYKN